MAKTKILKIYFSNKKTGYTSYTYISIKLRKPHHSNHIMTDYFTAKDKFFTTHSKGKYLINDIEEFNRC